MKITPNPTLLQLLASHADTQRPAQPRNAGNEQAQHRPKAATQARPRTQAVNTKAFEPQNLNATKKNTQNFNREAPNAGRQPKYVAPGQLLNIIV